MTELLLIYIAIIVTAIAVSVFRGSGDWRLKMLRRENAKLHREIADLLSGETLPFEVQKKIDEIFKKVNANTEKLSKATDDNTPK